jgi:hypothetical protein
MMAGIDVNLNIDDDGPTDAMSFLKRIADFILLWSLERSSSERIAARWISRSVPWKSQHEQL